MKLLASWQATQLKTSQQLLEVSHPTKLSVTIPAGTDRFIKPKTICMPKVQNSILRPTFQHSTSKAISLIQLQNPMTLNISANHSIYNSQTPGPQSKQKAISTPAQIPDDSQYIFQPPLPQFPQPTIKAISVIQPHSPMPLNISSNHNFQFPHIQQSKLSQAPAPSSDDSQHIF